MALPRSLVFQVNRTQPQLITPARPTPRETKMLSDIDDQQGLRFQAPVIAAFKNNPSMSNRKDPVQVIRAAISRALVYYYPLAGRLREGPNRKLMVDCNGEGVLFVGANADVTLEEIGDAILPPCPVLEDFLCNVPGSDGILGCPLLLVQVTILRCGGFILALRVNHTMCDALGFVLFLNTVGEMVEGKTAPSIPPVWEREILNYVQHGGVRSYGVDAELAKSTGSSLEVDKLTEEWESLYEKCPGIKNKAGTVGIIVRDPSKPPPKIKLVARKGKLEIDQEEVGTAPNGTEFVISTKDSPELDASTLVVGRVLEGMEVVERLGQVKTVQENTSSPYFRVAKLIGDKRAVVAERGFNRPYAKVVVTNCGLIQ